MEKVDFLIEYEVKPRELDSMCLVAAYLKSKGYSVAFVNSWESLYERPEPYDTVVAVLSACYDDGTYDGFAGLAHSFKKVVNMQWEQVLTNLFYKPHPYDFGDYQGVALETRHICWGRREKAWLETMYQIPPSCLNVLGYLPLDFYRPELKKLLIPREQLFAKYHLDPNRKTLLFVSSFTAVELPDSEKFGNLERLDDIQEISAVSQAIILDWFRQFVEEHPDIQLIYRAHPAEKASNLIQAVADVYPNFFVISEEPIRHWISACDKLLNWASTSMIEMFVSKKDSYILRPIPLPQDMDMCVFVGGTFIDNYNQFAEAIASSPEFPVPAQTLLQWYDIQETPAYQRIGDWLIETYHSDEYFSRPSNYNAHKHLGLKRLKRWFKHTAIFDAASSLFIKCIRNSPLSERLRAVRASVIYENDRLDPNGYAVQKRKQNAASAQEIESKIQAYLQVIQAQVRATPSTEAL